MKGQNIKKYQQKELKLMFKTTKKTRNYIILCHTTKCPTEAKKLNMRKWAIIDFGGQMETKYNRISILVL